MRILSFLTAVMCVSAAYSYDQWNQDEQLARKAAWTATRLFAADLQNEQAKAYYALAKKLAPEHSSVSYLKSMLEQKKNPKAPPSADDPKELDSMLVTRAFNITKQYYPKNVALADLALLYLLTVDAAKGLSDQGLYALCFLRRQGHQQTCGAILGAEWTLDELWKKSEPAPTPTKLPDVPKRDRKIAATALITGTGLLAKSPQHPIGLQLVRLAHFLEPESLRVSVILAKAEREQTIKTMRGRGMDLADFARKLVERANVLAERSQRSPSCGLAAAAYYLVAKEFAPDTSAIDSGLAKCGHGGKTLAELFQTSLPEQMTKDDKATLLASASSEEKAEDQPGNLRREILSDLRNEQEVDQDNLEGDKLRVSVDTHKKRVQFGTSESRVPTISLRAEITNYIPGDVEGLTAEYYMIGELNNQREDMYCVMEKAKKTGISIKERRNIELPLIRARTIFKPRGNGIKYYSHVVVIRDRNNKIINVDSKKDFLAKLAEKLPNYTQVGYTERKDRRTNQIIRKINKVDFFDKTGTIVNKDLEELEVEED